MSSVTAWTVWVCCLSDCLWVSVCWFADSCCEELAVCLWVELCVHWRCHMLCGCCDAVTQNRRLRQRQHSLPHCTAVSDDTEGHLVYKDGDILQARCTLNFSPTSNTLLTQNYVVFSSYFWTRPRSIQSRWCLWSPNTWCYNGIGNVDIYT